MSQSETLPQPTCRLCEGKVDPTEEDDFQRELCSSCKTRPEARRLGVVPINSAVAKVGVNSRPRPARDFTQAEKSLIRPIHGYTPAEQLLAILNKRLARDLGPDAAPHTMDQLYVEIGNASSVTPAGGHDWDSLRKLIAKARREGVLDAINEQTINDFAVVFSLNQKQSLVLKDILLQPKEE